MQREMTRGDMTRGGAERAFTMIELMVVMIIIAIIIALVVPVLGNVRNSARMAGTKSLMTQVTQAAAQFQTDHRRMPGYFSAQQMGAAANEDSGFSAMENILLDLMAIQVDPANPPAGATLITVGPDLANPAGRVELDFDLIGSAANGTKSYFAPDAKHFVPQTVTLQQVGQEGNTGADGVPQMPDLVDDWGQPFLGWAEDERAIGDAEFAAIDSAGSAPARFYWNSNGCFLKAVALGKRGRDQTDTEAGSLIGGGMSDQDRIQSLAAILGHPAYPIRPASGNPIEPQAARGKLVVHSAGADGVYFGRKDPGARQFPGLGPMQYEVNFVTVPGGTTGYTTRDGKPDVHDVTGNFDDLWQATGN